MLFGSPVFMETLLLNRLFLFGFVAFESTFVSSSSVDNDLFDFELKTLILASPKSRSALQLDVL